MTKVALDAYFEVEGLWVEPEALGSKIYMHFDDIVVQVELPADAESFEISPSASAVMATDTYDDDPRDQTPKNPVRLLRRGSSYDVRIIRSLANGDFPDLPHADEIDDPAAAAEAEEMARKSLLDCCTSAVTDFLEWAWARRGQTWIAPPSGEYPRLVSSLRLIDIERSFTYPQISIAAGRFRVIPHEAVISKSDIDEIEKWSHDRDKPTLAELLLAEAKHYLWGTEQRSLERAILLAAMACEVRIKAALRDLAPADHLPWVELVLDNPRDVTVEASNLWHKALKAATGRSLSEQNPALFQRLKRLTTLRNRIVHEGESADAVEARELVEAAREAFDWLGPVDHGGDS